MATGTTARWIRRLRRQAPALPVVIVVLGLVATVMGGLLIQRLGEIGERQRFEAVADQANGAISDRLSTYMTMLQAAAGLFAASEAVSLREFRAFAGRLDLTEHYPGVQGLGFSARVAPGEEAALEARMRAEGRPGFTIVRAGDPAEETHAILYLEPEDARNRAAIGFDMFSHPVRREAMMRARDTGRPAMSGKVELMQEIEEPKQAGFLIYEPVYAGGAVPATVEGRRDLLRGFVYAPFRAGDMLQAVFDTVEPKPYRYAVYNGEVRPENLLYRSGPKQTAKGGGLTAVRRVSVAGGVWTVVYRADASFEPSAARQTIWLFVAGGFLATALVAAATWRQGVARLAAEREVAARKAVEARQTLLLDELNHRVKNTLATVQVIAAQSLRETDDVEGFRRNFEDRLIALSQAHNLLTQDEWRGASLRELAAIELRPYAGAGEERMSLEGPDVWLAPNTAVALGMALHELTTNAVKYGALSRVEGRILLSWAVEPVDETTDRVSLLWREVDGPPVKPPARRGFGSRLIVGGLAHQLDGEVRLDFPPEGAVCSITFTQPRDTSPDMLRLGASA